METSEIDGALGRAEEALAEGGSLAGTGFWPAVSAVKAEPELVGVYAGRIAAIDQTAFRRWAFLVVPLWVGTLAMVAATIGGLALIWWSYYTDGFTAALVFGAGTGILLVTTHGLAHLLVGAIVGIRFTAWFIGKISQPQPGVKVDYVSYLSTPARSRAWMHASGAIATKLMPWLLIGAALASGAPTWVAWVLVGVGVVTLVTDIAWSTSSSDWKKFRREMTFAQE